MKIINQIVEEFKKDENIEAIALAGSLGASSSDEMSDYDICDCVPCAVLSGFISSSEILCAAYIYRYI